MQIYVHRLKHLIVAFLLISCLPLFSQDFDNYQPTAPQGEIPKEFITTSSVKYDIEKEKIKSKGYSKRAERQFHLENSFLISELLQSGKVLFNEPITNYVNQVALEDIFPLIPKSKANALQFYVVRSSAINAFATNDGKIFINMGLLAKLESRAELVFILCHEVIHYLEEHNIESFVEDTRIDRGKNEYRKANYDEKLLARSNYSKKHEMEADQDGLEIYLKTGFPPEAAGSALEKLKTSDIPFEASQPFDLALFQNPYFPIDSSAYLDSIIPVLYDEDDKYSTHPSLNKRTEYVKDRIRGYYAKDSTRSFHEADSSFQLINQMARFEVARLFLFDRRYDKALFVYHNLISQYPNSAYLRTIFLKALYGIAVYESDDELYRVIPLEEDVNAELQPYCFALNSLKRKLYFTNATQFAFNDLKDFSSPSIDKIRNDLCSYMVGKIHPDSVGWDTTNLHYYRIAYDSFMSNDQFKTMSETLIKDQKDQKKKRARNLRKDVQADRYVSKHGHALGLKKIVLVDPFYYTLSIGRKEAVLYLKAEKSLFQFNKALKENASLLNLKMDLLSAKQLRSKEIETFNDISCMKAYMNDKMTDDIQLVSVDYDEISLLSAKYETDYIGLSGAIVFKESKSVATKIYTIFWSLLVPPLIPFAIYASVNPDYDYYNYMVLFDTHHDKLHYVNYHSMKFKDTHGTVNSTVYYNLLQIKREIR